MYKQEDKKEREIEKGELRLKNLKVNERKKERKIKRKKEIK